MFTISVETRFQASHSLVLPDGSLEPSHNHDWLITAVLSSDKLNNTGIVTNFHEIREMLNKTVAHFEGKSLQQTDYFQKKNPSAENVAKYIYDKIKPQLPHGVKLQAIKVVEEPGCSAKFSE
ncbi:6-pyruvoyl tetrahydropterin synthase family protein [Planctomycetota bacterium]